MSKRNKPYAEYGIDRFIRELGIKRPNWKEPFPPSMKLGNLTAAFEIRVTYQDRVQVTVMGHTVSGEDLQDALAQAFQVVAMEQYTEGYSKGYSEARD